MSFPEARGVGECEVWSTSQRGSFYKSRFHCSNQAFCKCLYNYIRICGKVFIFPQFYEHSIFYFILIWFNKFILGKFSHEFASFALLADTTISKPYFGTWNINYWDAVMPLWVPSTMEDPMHILQPVLHQFRIWACLIFIFKELHLLNWATLVCDDFHFLMHIVMSHKSMKWNQMFYFLKHISLRGALCFVLLDVIIWNHGNQLVSCNFYECWH